MPPNSLLQQEILAFITDASWDLPDDTHFNVLACQAFEYQFQNNRPYRRFCEGIGVTPQCVRQWQDIPALSTEAFKVADLMTFPVENIVETFLTSGTTASRSGRHHFDTLERYDASLIRNFLRHLLPDGLTLPMFILTPPPQEAPHSSLIYMIETLRKRFAAPESDYFIQNGTLLVQKLLDRLFDAERTHTPIFLLGTAFSFVHFMDALAQSSTHRPSFGLASGSRIMETGGFKGKSREIEKGAFYTLLSETFGILDQAIVNEYGMTEMGSQFYDVTFLAHHQGKVMPRCKSVPPWVRTLILDPETLTPILPGKIGLLRHIDLANLSSVIALQTADLGTVVGPGFEILGRTKDAPPRGCSLAIDEILTRTQG